MSNRWETSSSDASHVSEYNDLPYRIISRGEIVSIARELPTTSWIASINNRAFSLLIVHNRIDS